MSLDKPKKQKIEKCTACKKPQVVDYWNNCELVKCIRCKHRYYVGDKKILNKVYALLYYSYNAWIRSNWTKIRTTNYGNIISERVIYESWCWNCKEPIYAVMENDELLFGNKKCRKQGCNKFICNNCGVCFCDYGLPKYEIENIRKKWVSWNPQKDAHLTRVFS